MSSCGNCIHRGALVNQGIHWCELQIEGYPDKEDCEQFEMNPSFETIFNKAADMIYAASKKCRSDLRAVAYQLHEEHPEYTIEDIRRIIYEKYSEDMYGN